MLSKQQTKDKASQKRLYVQNLNSSVTEEDLIELFELNSAKYLRNISWATN